jgi:predicted O-methyltransferase YrrM
MASNGVEAHDRCGFELPGMVQAALRRAREMEFTNACLPEQGRLLELLARGRSGGRIGECGTGCGIALAWMVSAASATTRLVSMEHDVRLAAAAVELFQESNNVTVLCADWTAIADWAPFDLLVLDAGAKVDRRLDPVDLLAPGGGLVIDDFTPIERWPPLFGGEVDADRLHWFEHPRLLATEIRLTPTASSLVAIRRSRDGW